MLTPETCLLRLSRSEKRFPTSFSLPDLVQSSRLHSLLIQFWLLSRLLISTGSTAVGCIRSGLEDSASESAATHDLFRNLQYLPPEHAKESATCNTPTICTSCAIYCEPARLTESGRNLQISMMSYSIVTFLCRSRYPLLHLPMAIYK